MHSDGTDGIFTMPCMPPKRQPPLSSRVRDSYPSSGGHGKNLAFYACRIVGRDRHYRNFNRVAFAGGAGGARSSHVAPNAKIILKQLGLGFQNFASVNKGFPARRYNSANQGYTGWGTFILPFIEEQSLFAQYNFSYDFSTLSIKL